MRPEYEQTIFSHTPLPLGACACSVDREPGAWNLGTGSLVAWD